MRSIYIIKRSIFLTFEWSYILHIIPMGKQCRVTCESVYLHIYQNGKINKCFWSSFSWIHKEKSKLKFYLLKSSKLGKPAEFSKLSIIHLVFHLQNLLEWKCPDSSLQDATKCFFWHSILHIRLSLFFFSNVFFDWLIIYLTSQQNWLTIPIRCTNGPTCLHFMAHYRNMASQEKCKFPY